MKIVPKSSIISKLQIFKNGGRIPMFKESGTLQIQEGLNIPTYEGDFGNAFTQARMNKVKTFRWNGNLYNTNIDYDNGPSLMELLKPQQPEQKTPDLDIYHKFSSRNYDEFVKVLYPIFEKALKKQGYSTTHLQNLIRQAGLESDYGLKPVGSQGFNLGGIKWENNPKSATYKYKHSTNPKDNEEYIDFDSLEDYADYKVWLLDDTYDALNAANTSDFIERLHGKNKYKKHYSEDKQSYIYNLNHMRSLDSAYNNYVSTLNN